MRNMTHIYKDINQPNTVITSSRLSIDEIGQIPNGSIPNIFCDCLDTIDFVSRQSIQDDVLKKVMIGGRIIIRSANTTILAKKILNGSISIEHINQHIAGLNSIVDENYIINWLRSKTNFKIEKIDFDSLHLNISIQRKS